MVYRCPNSQAHYNEAVIYLNCGTPKNNEFSIWNKWKIYYFLVSQYLSTLGYSYREEYLLGEHSLLFKRRPSLRMQANCKWQALVSPLNVYPVILNLMSHPNISGRIANRANLYQTLFQQSDLGLNCLVRILVSILGYITVYLTF